MTSAHIESAPRRPALVPPAAIAPLAEALGRCPADRFSGTLHVAGHPGGVVHLDQGVITAVDSPGAPDVSTLLLRSGRICEADWAAAVKAGLTDRRIGAELTSRMLIGAAELQVMCQMAALDAAFAIAVGRIDGCELGHDAPGHWLPAQQGIDLESLLRETERRLGAFTRGSILIAPYQDRLSLGPRAAERLESLPGGDEGREILVRVNGRRSARDIAFLLGRSVYAVTARISRMVGDGLVEISARPVVTDPKGGGPSLATLRPRPREVSTSEASAGPPAASPSASPDTSPGGSGLPYRRRGVGGINDILPLRPIITTRSVRRRD